MDRAGNTAGALVSEVRNVHSNRMFVVSTALEIGQDYWTTAVFPVLSERRWFGLSSRSTVDAANPVLLIIRNTQQSAEDAHSAVKAVVALHAQDQWENGLPSREPPDGWSPGARAKLRAASGAAAAPIFSEDPNLEAAYRILVRGSRNPGAYFHDPRYVLFFACESLATLVAGKGNLAAVGTVVGESPEIIEGILRFAGYNVPALTTGNIGPRLLEAMAATTRLFPDIAEKYGPFHPNSNRDG